MTLARSLGQLVSLGFIHPHFSSLFFFRRKFGKREKGKRRDQSVEAHTHRRLRDPFVVSADREVFGTYPAAHFVSKKPRQYNTQQWGSERVGFHPQFGTPVNKSLSVRPGGTQTA